VGGYEAFDHPPIGDNFPLTHRTRLVSSQLADLLVFVGAAKTPAGSSIEIGSIITYLKV